MLEIWTQIDLPNLVSSVGGKKKQPAVYRCPEKSIAYLRRKSGTSFGFTKSIYYSDRETRKQLEKFILDRSRVVFPTINRITI